MFKLIKYTIKDILTSKMRSLLTIFGIVVGIASVTIMVSIGESSQKYIEQNLSNQMNEKVLTVTLGEDNEESFISTATLIGRFSNNDYEILQELEKENGKFTLSRVGVAEVELSFMNTKQSTTVMVIDPEYHKIMETEVTKGEIFNINSSNLKQIVIDNELSKEIFKIQDPINQKIKLNSVEFEISGVMENRTMLMNQKLNISHITYNSYKELFGKNPEITAFFIGVENKEDLESVKKEIIAALKISREIGFGETADFTVQSQEDLLGKTREITNALKLFITIISSISLFVGGVGIMNIMLVSVKERVKEFGLRKAIGASNTDIMQQIILESIIFSIIGAIIGAIIGEVFALFIQTIANLPLLISIKAITNSIIVSTVVGVVFGFYPAITASKLSPIEALRSE